ncbi:MAG: DUF4147 domain-containing protein [Planctomycetota bacterium]
MKPEAFVRIVIDAALRAADPASAVARHWPEVLDDGKPTRLLALGKGSPKMLGAALSRLGSSAVCACSVHPPGTARIRTDYPIEWIEADHPFPTPRSLAAGERVAAVAEEASSGERVLVLVSGGASALISMPREGVPFEDLVQLTHALLRSGATIDEINTVRTRCEVLKGGGLARRCAPAEVLGLVLSDVIGDRLASVSSGPTVIEATQDDPAAVMHQYGLAGRWASIDAAVARPREFDQDPPDVTNVVVGSNRLAVESIAADLQGHGFSRVVTECEVTGDCGERALLLAQAARKLGPGEAIVWGGETTVVLGEAQGRGGRNQELALCAVPVIAGEHDLVVVSFGTDGIDGPTDAAGGFVTGETAALLSGAGIDLGRELGTHDSYPALETVGGLIRTGPTGTNVNDVMVGARLPGCNA